ncbi:MAG TPA: glycosyltransferase family 9 protein [Candidatus Omnitrophota bacterium]|nr:glycosyltransferase family 9 protein [Candidatus Omnitrophota bacterium]HPS36128.1 glycosyltransferase family 9 protein [Candidatus Omnitrophota bacterium]
MKIIVVMKNWLGDLLFQMPALDLILKRYPNAKITCVAPERCREILEAHPAVSGFISLDEKSTHRSWLSRVKFLWELQKAGPWDEGYLFHRSRSRALWLLFAGVQKRIGYGRGRGMLLTKAVPEPEQPMHQLDYFLNLMEKAGYSLPEERSYRFYYKNEDVAHALRVLREHGIEKGARYFCFHLGANWEPKRWPPEHFAILAEMLYDKWHLPLVVTGSINDEPILEAFMKGVRRAKIVPLVGKTALRVSAVIYKYAACLVTGDSGPMHIASGVGAPLAALFGPTDPKLTGPRGTGDSTVIQYVPEGYQVPWYGDLPVAGWLSHIKPEEVFAAVERILRSHGS